MINKPVEKKTADKKKSDAIQVAAGWTKKSKNGSEFISFKVADGITLEAGDYFNVFTNEKKEGNQPDYRAVVFPKKEDE